MKIKETFSRGSPFLISLALLTIPLLTTSCDRSADYADGKLDDPSSFAAQLTIQTPTITTYATDGYEDGAVWENYIDINDGDYRIYFFTDDKDDASATDDSERNTLISEFAPYDIEVVENTDYTSYIATGRVDAEVASYGDFKIVMLANWGAYPEVTAGKTTIDDICNAASATFDAFVDGDNTALMPSSDLRIPFFGLREYSDVVWRVGWRTILSGDITLLRAVAKVEIRLENDVQDDVEIAGVTLCGYNAQGYCAPSGVYRQSDYDSGYKDWSSDFADNLHLVGTDAQGNGVNDAGAENRRLSFLKTGGSAAGGTGTWTAYLPEFYNGDDGYSYIEVVLGHQLTEDDGWYDTPYIVYFGNYADGVCTAYDNSGDTADRLDVHRNYIYRFNVKYTMGGLVVSNEPWEEVFDNEWTFGDFNDE
ncbi:MAG: hypothetical protein LUD72_02355 [Bacteroidales bacterium]|nr:hypothetical protein [Bacteroidales bacterium]